MSCVLDYWMNDEKKTTSSKQTNRLFLFIFFYFLTMLQKYIVSCFFHKKRTCISLFSLLTTQIPVCCCFYVCPYDFNIYVYMQSLRIYFCNFLNMCVCMRVCVGTGVLRICRLSGFGMDDGDDDDENRKIAKEKKASSK